MFHTSLKLITMSILVQLANFSDIQLLFNNFSNFKISFTQNDQNVIYKTLAGN